MQSHMRRGTFGAQRIKTADSSKKILVSWATGPKAHSANQKEAAYKRPKIKRAGNAQRKQIVHPHSALAVFLTDLLTRAGERTARTLLQRKYRRTRETQHANGVPFSHHKQNTHPTSLPAALAKQRQPRAEGQHEN
jgi:hypothetical protein